MFYKTGITAGLVAAIAVAPAVSQTSGGQVQAATPSATGPAEAATSSSPFGVYSYNQQPTVDSAAESLVASIAGIPASEIPGATEPVLPVISPQVTGPTSHGPFSGTPTTTGALSTIALASEIPILPPSQAATTYVPNGTLHQPQPVPYQPAGGLGTNGTEPVYRVQSDFDYQSTLLGLYQEWIELDLFHDILAKFSEENFTAAGLTPSDRFLIKFMADQEAGHVTLLSSLLGGPGGATPQCTYNYPYSNVTEAFDFAQKLTRYGESGVWGFQAHLDSREVAQLLSQTIATEARQQMIFRQFAGLFPMPVWFETGIPQSWAWTLLAPYISSCPSNSKRLVWQNFPQLTVLNQPNIARRNATQTGFNETVGFGPAAPSNSSLAPIDACIGSNVTGFNCSAAISQNRSIPLSFPGRKVFLQWENPGKPIGPNNSYITSSSAGAPQWALWVSQLNITYSPLLNVSSTNGSNFGMTIQPDISTYEGDPAINGTMFLALTDTNITYSAFNLSSVNPHVVALALYQAG
ncbi:hypothetical protein NHQ30_004867 [Ciborinia camelliae]|nr:hypothetical protein NHQ30_004867 [Ciborinia camelliae]